MMEQDICYYRRRASEERLAAGQAANVQAQQCHFELAAAYDERVRDLKARQRRMEFRIVTAA
jgi:hypothetical protein